MEETGVVGAQPVGAAADPSAERTRIGTPVDGERVLGALSPSRAGDFKACPLMYRLRTIDRLPEEPSPSAVRGTVVHKVLEDLFDLPAAERTPDRAETMVEDAWDFVVDADPELAAMFAAEVPEAGVAEAGVAEAGASEAEVSEAEVSEAGASDTGPGRQIAEWLQWCRESLRGYFALEDPRRLEPAEREVYVEALLDSKLLLRGFVDRIDIAADGAIRVVDYKTGRSPGVGFESKALFQMRFYALVIWRTRGVVPALLQLIYLGDGQKVSYRPDEQDLRATERLVEALWRAIEEARVSGEWLPNPGAACRWCSYQAHCPAFGNQPPPLPSQPATVSPPSAS